MYFLSTASEFQHMMRETKMRVLSCHVLQILHILVSGIITVIDAKYGMQVSEAVGYLYKMCSLSYAANTLCKII